eukprot:8055534-Alexandrium_andersonii.AAC.1
MVAATAACGCVNWMSCMLGEPTGGREAPLARRVCKGEGLHTCPVGARKRCGISAGGGVRGSPVSGYALPRR